LNSRFLRNGLVTLVLVVGTAALLYTFLGQGNDTDKVDYDGDRSFLQLVGQGDVQRVEQRADGRLRVTLTDPGENGQPQIIETTVPSQFATQIALDMRAACDAGPSCATVPNVVGLPADEGGAWIGLLLTALLPIMLIGFFIFFMFRQAQGTNNQAMSFGKSRARMFLGNKQVVTFADVAREVQLAGRPHPARRAAGRSSGHRQDPARSRRGR
jgi:cell division protease FtsH